MSVPASKELPFRVDAFCYARNGAVPDVRFLNRVASAQNHILAYRTKMVFGVWDPSWTNAGLFAPTAITQHRFRFHAGYGARSLLIVLGLGRGSHASTGVATTTIEVTAAGGGVVASEVVTYGHTLTAATDAPDEIQWTTHELLISPNTTYEVSATVINEARILSMTAATVGIEDVDDGNDFYTAPSSTYGQIDDFTRQKLTEGLSKMWKRNGAHLLNWSCNAVPATTSGATWKNVTDATTAVASTSAGYILGGGLLTPYGRRVQPLKATLCVYGQVTGGAGTGEVRLYSDSGSGTPTFATVTGIGATAQWYATNQTIPVGGDALNAFSKVDLQHRMNGAGQMNLHAVSLYLYET